MPAQRRFDASWRIVAAMLVASGVSACSRLPWNEANQTAPETNLSFTVKQNLIYVRFHAGGREGRGIVSTRHPSTILDESFAATATRQTPRIRLGSTGTAEADPRLADLQGIGDAILARDLWGDQILTIDWRSALVSLHRERSPAADGRSFTWAETPRVRLTLDGSEMEVEIDSTSPEALVLPGELAGRREGVVELAGSTHDIDVATDPRVPHPRIGTRLLSKYLTQIDYGRRRVTLWPNQ